MGLLKHIWEWLTRAAGGTPAKAHPDLRPIDVSKLARELNLHSEARRLGESGIPAPDATTYSGPEAAAIQRVEKARQDYVDWAVIRLSVVNENIAREDITRDINRARQADQEFIRKAGALMTEREAILGPMRDAVENLTLELKAFRSEHGLTRQAHYPEGAGLFLRWSVLVLLIVVEAILNATFFAQGLQSGLIAGAAVAGALAALNVTVAFMTGWLAGRYRSHRKPVRAALGWLSIVGALCAMVAIGLAIAHYRNALIAEAPNASAVALKTFLASPFQLNEILPWGLFAISVAFALGALFDGLHMDDSYPGYGAIDRRAKEAVDDYEDELAVLREELDELKNEELRLLDETVRKAQVSLRSLASAIGDKEAAGSRLHTAFRDADHAVETLLRLFRTENEVHRKGLPRPAYFEKTVELRPIRLPDFDVSVDQAQMQNQGSDLDALLNELEQIRARIQAAFNQEFDRLKPLGPQFTRQEA